MVKNSASPKHLFVFGAISPFLEGTTHEHYHFQSKNRGHTTHTLLIFLRRGGGGHTTHAYSFSYGTTPKSSPKGGGGGHVPEMHHPRSTYVYTLIVIINTHIFLCARYIDV